MGLLDEIFNTKARVSTTIENCLEKLSDELGCKPTELFIMIMPNKNEFSDATDAMNFQNWVYRMENGKPKLVREISLEEILDG
jgi:hypothetical protein